MTSIRDLLQEADPLRNEPMPSSERHALRRESILAAASHVRVSTPTGLSRVRLAVFAVALGVITAVLLGARLWFPLVNLVNEVHAAVRFEIRLAEEKPSPGLREAKVSDSGQSVYLHNEIIVSNSDISAARIVQSVDSPQYAVDVQFNPSGAEKMRAATRDNVGKLVAILLDGKVVMAPVIRSPISSSALITGHFTKDQAEKLAKRLVPR